MCTFISNIIKQSGNFDSFSITRYSHEQKLALGAAVTAFTAITGTAIGAIAKTAIGASTGAIFGILVTPISGAIYVLLSKTLIKILDIKKIDISAQKYNVLGFGLQLVSVAIAIVIAVNLLSLIGVSISYTNGFLLGMPLLLLTLICRINSFIEIRNMETTNNVRLMLIEGKFQPVAV